MFTLTRLQVPSWRGTRCCLSCVPMKFRTTVTACWMYARAQDSLLLSLFSLHRITWIRTITVVLFFITMHQSWISVSSTTVLIHIGFLTSRMWSPGHFHSLLRRVCLFLQSLCVYMCALAINLFFFFFCLLHNSCPDAIGSSSDVWRFDWRRYWEGRGAPLRQGCCWA